MEIRGELFGRFLQRIRRDEDGRMTDSLRERIIIWKKK